MPQFYAIDVCDEAAHSKVFGSHTIDGMIRTDIPVKKEGNEMALIYHVKTEGIPDTFMIENHRPEGAEAPKTEGRMRYIPGIGFEVTMRCWETEPRAAYREPDGPVFKDSCMEVFLDCFPELPQYGYINVEMNAAGFAPAPGINIGRHDCRRASGSAHPGGISRRRPP